MLVWKKILRLFAWGVFFVLATILLVTFPLLIRGGEASTESIVSRVKSDTRSLATAIETYHIDHGAYPPTKPFPEEWREPYYRKLKPREIIGPEGAGAIRNITSPVAYITSEFADPWSPFRGETFAYFPNGNGWILISRGPNRIFDILQPADVYTGLEIGEESEMQKLAPYTYDSSNGTESTGDIWRVKQTP